MKSKKLYGILLLSICLVESCSKDLGNYNYQPVNAIIISGLLEGDHPTSRIYDIPFQDTLRLNPVVTGSISENDTSVLIFEWQIDSVAVAHTKNLIYAANRRYGRISAQFNVTDQSTGSVTSYNFFLNVVNPYKWGYYVLTHNTANQAYLYCLSTITKDAVFEQVLIPNLSDLGRNPMSISGVKKYGGSSSDFYNVLTLAVQDAANPVVMLDSREFVPTLYYNSSNYVGGGNFNFRPTQIVVDPYFEIIYAINNGKFHVLQKGSIALAAFPNDPLDYQVAANGIATPYGNGKYFMSIYDEKNKKVRVWDNGVTSNEFVYINDYQEIPGQEMMNGKTFLACSYANIPSINQIYLFREGNQLYSYRLDYNANYKPSTFSLQGSGSMPTSSEITYVYFDGRTSRWYMAAGNTIYMASFLGVEFQKFVELPANAKGDILTFKNLDNKLMIATNDSSAANPGSIYIYNANTLLLEQSYENVVGKIVDIHLGI